MYVSGGIDKLFRYTHVQRSIDLHLETPLTDFAIY